MTESPRILFDWLDALFVAGVLAVVGGIAWIYRPAGLIALGVALLWIWAQMNRKR